MVEDGWGIYSAERLCMWLGLGFSIHPEIEPPNPLNLYTINSPSRSFYKPNGQNSLLFHILQLVKVSPLSYGGLEGSHMQIKNVAAN